METVRLTTAQAIVRWLIAQRIEVDGVESPVFAGAFGIFEVGRDGDEFRSVCRVETEEGTAHHAVIVH